VEVAIGLKAIALIKEVFCGEGCCNIS
jgi:hypothetical protein